jgi:ABC-type dipeptide/oligopeptide/nickel transport system ATPase subunit
MPAASDPLVRIENLSFAYHERIILDGTSFSVPRGKVTALMGASGAQGLATNSCSSAPAGACWATAGHTAQRRRRRPRTSRDGVRERTVTG